MGEILLITMNSPDALFIKRVPYIDTRQYIMSKNSKILEFCQIIRPFEF